MDKEEDKAASEEKDHIPSENERSSTEECLPGAKETEKETKHVIKNIPWTASKNFTVERGRQQIEELISTWDIHESWLHHSEFLEEEELKDSKRYHYRTCWGLPTRRKPLPQATANVYFVIVISKLKPDGLYMASALSLLADCTCGCLLQTGVQQADSEARTVSV